MSIFDDPTIIPGKTLDQPSRETILIRLRNLLHLVRANGFEVAENLIPEYERVTSEAQPTWFLMENVPDAPLPAVPGYGICDRLISNRDDCGGEQNRVRRFSFGLRGMANLAAALRFTMEWPSPPVPMAWSPAVTASRGGDEMPVKVGGSGKRKRGSGGALRKTSWMEALRLQGLPAGWDLPGLTVAAKGKALGNGVPLPMGRAVARAVRRALGLPILEAA